MFKFLKRLRGEKPEPVVAEVVEAPPEPDEERVVVEVENDLPTQEVEAPAHKDFEPKDSDPKDSEPKAPEKALETKTYEAPVPVVEVELPERGLGEGIRSLFNSDVDLEDLEDILLRADFGVDAAVAITEDLKKAANKSGASSDAELRLLLKDLLTARLTRKDAALNLSSGDLPYVILVVGVNGAGKTTTIGKLSRWLKDGDWNVVLGAADTFRAAAVEQLGTWAERAEAKLVRPEREGQDPASVAYQTVELALREQADIAIIDTAGRLQNKKDLMDELGKIRRAVEKQARITEVLLVIDATTGQNAIAQARAFTEVADVTGIVMTKLDGTAKGGIVYSLQQQLDLPVKLVGVGEGINDFAFFSPEQFAKGLVAYKR
jgi:fused signal recognition particle receptor